MATVIGRTQIDIKVILENEESEKKVILNKEKLEEKAIEEKKEELKPVEKQIKTNKKK